VSRSGEPLLADFGLSRMAESFRSKGFNTTDTSRSSTHWLPYEYHFVQNSDKFHPNPKSDVWAFGMTLLELLTGEIPYPHIKNEGAIYRAMGNMVLPVKPKFEGPDAKLKDDIWLLCLKCWTIVRSEECLKSILTQERLEEIETQAHRAKQEALSTDDRLKELTTQERQKYTGKLLMQERRPLMQAILKKLIRMKYRHGVGFDDQQS